VTVGPGPPGGSGGQSRPEAPRPGEGTGRPGSGSGQGSSRGPAPPGSAEDSRAEVVLSQALHAMAGGQSGGQAGSGGRASPHLSTGQLVLLAAIVGLLVGIGAGLLSLLL
jgi:hypothetical protein